MKKSCFTLRMVAACLSLGLILIPMSSSVSMTQNKVSPTAVPAGTLGTDRMSEAAIVRISAAVVATGALIAVTAYDDETAATHHQQ
jgi:hypothetical protein